MFILVLSLVLLIEYCCWFWIDSIFGPTISFSDRFYFSVCLLFVFGSIQSDFRPIFVRRGTMKKVQKCRPAIDTFRRNRQNEWNFVRDLLRQRSQYVGRCIMSISDEKRYYTEILRYVICPKSKQYCFAMKMEIKPAVASHSHSECNQRRTPY